MIDKERAAHCHSCGTAIPPDEQTYTLRVEMFASARPPCFDDEELLVDNRAEWERLLSKMSAMAPKGVEEETDKVFERYEFTLCGQCRRTHHESLKGLTP